MTSQTVRIQTPGGDSVVVRLRRRFGVITRLTRAILRSSTDVTMRNELLARLIEYEEYASLMNCVAASPSIAPTSASAAASVPLLVTTNRGLFLLNEAQWRCLLPVTCFGIARDADTLYLGASASIYSFVLAARISNTPNACTLNNIRILIRYETRYHNERIHQIAYDPRKKQVICANCRRNSLLIIDADSGKIIDEKFLFVDGTGFPVHTDQNHVNSVAPHGDALIFSAHSAGENFGTLGFVADDRVRAYRYQARGVHDIVIHDGGIMFTDSFRDALAAANPDISGAIRCRGDNYRLDATGIIPRKVVLRGLAARDGAVVVGYSAYASRENRQLAGSGGVIVIGRDSAGTAIDGPFSQVYDVLPFDGVRTDRAGAPCSVDELDRMFRRDVGPLLYEAPVARSARMAELR